MKTPISMLEDIAAELVENISLLEVIYRINEFPPEADNAMACLIRSMHKTLDKVNEYIDQIVIQPPPLRRLLMTYLMLYLQLKSSSR